MNSGWGFIGDWTRSMSVCVCMHVCKNVYIHTHAQTNIYQSSKPCTVLQYPSRNTRTMNECVCKYVCIHIYAHTHAQTNTYLYMCIHAYTHTHKNRTCVRVCAHMCMSNIHTWISKHTRMRVCVCATVYTCMYIHARTDRHMLWHTHTTHIHESRLWLHRLLKTRDMRNLKRKWMLWRLRLKLKRPEVRPSHVWHTHTHMTHWVQYDSLICVTWLIHMCDVTHSRVRHGARVAIHMCDTHRHRTQCVRHDSITYVSWLIQMCDVTNLLSSIPFRMNKEWVMWFEVSHATYGLIHASWIIWGEAQDNHGSFQRECKALRQNTGLFWQNVGLFWQTIVWTLVLSPTHMSSVRSYIHTYHFVRKYMRLWWQVEYRTLLAECRALLAECWALLAECWVLLAECWALWEAQDKKHDEFLSYYCWWHVGKCWAVTVDDIALHVVHDSFMCVTWLIHVCHACESRLIQTSLIHVSYDSFR